MWSTEVRSPVPRREEQVHLKGQLDSLCALISESVCSAGNTSRIQLSSSSSLIPSWSKPLFLTWTTELASTHFPSFIFLFTYFLKFFFFFFWCRPFLKKRLYWILYSTAHSFMFCFFGHNSCGILTPWPGIEPTPSALEGEILATGPPKKSQPQLCSFTSFMTP